MELLPRTHDSALHQSLSGELAAEHAEIAEIAETFEIRPRQTTVQLTTELAEFAKILHLPRPMKDRLNQITETIIGAAIDVHRELGPGLLESAYESCLCLELIKRGLTIERQKAMPLVYQGVPVGTGYRVDLLVEGAVVVEVKAIERFEPVHLAQILSYLRFTGSKVGLLLNFNVKWLAEKGIKRVVSNFPD